MGKRGFTLVELTVVIAILAILAGIAVPAMAGYRDKAADGVNEVNLLTAQRQLRMLWDNSREDFREVSNSLRAEEEAFSIGSWQISAPKALGVRRGDHPVEAGTDMKAWLDENQEWTTSYEEGIAGEELGDAGQELPQPEPETPETSEPAVAEHDCYDRSSPYDCICDAPGCGEEIHAMDDAGNLGNCLRCGGHFWHVFMDNQLCYTCNWDEVTGGPHVCEWEEGQCLCRCGASRCQHGSPLNMGACTYCGQSNTRTNPCPNCN